MITLQQIIDHAAHVYGFSVEALLERRRTPSRCEARWVAMWVARACTRYSLPEIGDAFGRDHSTVYHAIRQVDERLDRDDPELVHRVQEVAKPFMDRPFAFERRAIA